MLRNTTVSQANLIAIALLAALSSGCQQQQHCTELGDCGGPIPLGSWRLEPGHPSCSEDLYEPPTDPRLRGGEVPVARQPIVEPALFDWCYGLVTNGGQNILARPPLFFYESGPIGWANIAYTANPGTDGSTGTYTLGISRTGTYVLDFPAYCMRAFGAMDDRPAYDSAGMPVGDPTNVCKQLELPLIDSGIGEGSYRNVICKRNPKDLNGCLCHFDVAETGGSTGSYQVIDKNTIMHLPYNNFPQKATYCNKGNSLELTGKDGNYLLGKAGLRSMNLARIVVDPCANGEQDPGEDGIDCGGTCMTACP